MAKVYVLSSVDYENTEILGVYTAEELANEAKDLASEVVKEVYYFLNIDGVITFHPKGHRDSRLQERIFYEYNGKLCVDAFDLDSTETLIAVRK